MNWRTMAHPYRYNGIANRLAVQLAVIVVALLFLNEFLIYYLQIAQCTWPELPASVADDNAPQPEVAAQRPVRALILADMHMLGPHRGHWADKLRREWQMHRAFQTAVTLHRPDVVFMLGDVFDEGQLVDEADFAAYVLRFRRLFHVPAGVRLYGALGNHDVGFHYRMRPELVRRFVRSQLFDNAKPNALITVGEVNFVLLNSMAMEADGCTLCRSAEASLMRIAEQLNCRKPGVAANSASCANRTDEERKLGYSAPVLLQHFPTWRPSDGDCAERDDTLELEAYRERWEVLSKRSSQWLGRVLQPRAVFSGHSHRYCRTRTVWGADEWTVNSFSWRNNNDPRFLMAAVGRDEHAVSMCEMPRESTVLWVYGAGVVVIAVMVLRSVILRCFGWMRRGYEKSK